MSTQGPAPRVKSKAKSSVGEEAPNPAAPAVDDGERHIICITCYLGQIYIYKPGSSQIYKDWDGSGQPTCLHTSGL